MKKRMLSIILIGIMLFSTGCTQRLVIEDSDTSEFVLDEISTVNKNENTTTVAADIGEDGSTGEDGEVITQNPSEGHSQPSGSGDTTTQAPTQAPTQKPTQAPTQAPTQKPTQAPTMAPPPSKEPDHSSEIDTLAKNIVSKIITSSMSSVEKVVAIHDYLTYNVDYDYANYLAGTIPSSSYSADGALKNGKAVCSGYASAFSVLAKAAGFEVTYVDGVANNGEGYQGHAWNEIKIDGVWYNVDVTWDDPTWSGKDPSDHSANCYTYFLVSDATLGKDHVPSYYVGHCSKDYSQNSICAAVANTRTDSTYFSSESDLKTKLKGMIDKGNTEFFVYSGTHMSDSWGKFNKAFVELKQPYYVYLASEPEGGICKYYVMKKEGTYCVSSQTELNAVIAANSGNLNGLELWYYDAGITKDNYYGMINAALIKTGYAAEMATSSLVGNGYVICTIKTSSTVIVNDLSVLTNLLNKYTVSQISTMKFAYTGTAGVTEVNTAIFDGFVPKGWFPQGLYTYDNYGVKFIEINDIRQVTYVTATDQIAQSVKKNGTGALAIDYAIKTTEANCYNICLDADQKIKSVSGYKVNSAYNYSYGYMMYMIESME